MWPDDENWKEPQSKAAFVKGAARIMENAKKRGTKVTEFNLYKDIALDSAACDYHSSVQDHQKLAARVIALLSSKPYQWARP